MTSTRTATGITAVATTTTRSEQIVRIQTAVHDVAMHLIAASLLLQPSFLTMTSGWDVHSGDERALQSQQTHTLT